MEKFQDIIKHAKRVILIVQNDDHLQMIIQGEKSRLCEMLEKAIQNSDGLRQILAISFESLRQRIERKSYNSSMKRQNKKGGLKRRLKKTANTKSSKRI